MAVDLKRFQALERDAEEKTRAAERARGLRDAALDRLKKEAGCKSVEDARRLAEKLRKELTAAEEDFAAELERLEVKND